MDNALLNRNSIIVMIVIGALPVAFAILWLLGRAYQRYPKHLRGHLLTALTWTAILGTGAISFVRDHLQDNLTAHLPLIVSGLAVGPAWRQLTERSNTNDVLKKYSFTSGMLLQSLWGPLLLGAALLGINIGGQSCFDQALECRDIQTAVTLKSLGLGTLDDPGHNYGQEPRLCQAVWTHDPELVATYLAVGGISKSGLNRALYASNDAVIMDLLLDHGASPEGLSSQCSWIDPPLGAAVREGKVDQVRVLLHHGADPLAKDNTGQTALHLAKASNNKDIITLFAPRIAAKGR